MAKDQPRPPGPPPGFGMPGGPQPLPQDHREAGDGATVVEFLGMFGGLVAAWAIYFGANHWAWWTLGCLSILCLATSLIRKFRYFRKQDEPMDLKPGNTNRPHGTPKGRKLSDPE